MAAHRNLVGFVFILYTKRNNQVKMLPSRSSRLTGKFFTGKAGRTGRKHLK
jgi:hypothetical protein